MIPKLTVNELEAHMMKKDESVSNAILDILKSIPEDTVIRLHWYCKQSAMEMKELLMQDPYMPMKYLFLEGIIRGIDIERSRNEVKQLEELMKNNAQVN